MRAPSPAVLVALILGTASCAPTSLSRLPDEGERIEEAMRPDDPNVPIPEGIRMGPDAPAVATPWEDSGGYSFSPGFSRGFGYGSYGGGYGLSSYGASGAFAPGFGRGLR